MKSFNEWRKLHESQDVISFLQDNEHEWVTVGLDWEENQIHIFPETSPAGLKHFVPRTFNGEPWSEKHFDGGVQEMTGKELLTLKDRVEFVMH
jgi:hypothetical protein